MKPICTTVVALILSLIVLERYNYIYTLEEPFETNNCPQLEPYCTCNMKMRTISCKGFTSFRELDFTKSSIKTTWSISLEPNRLLPLNNDLNFTGLNVHKSINIKLYNIDGFDLASNPFSTLSQQEDGSLLLSNSKIRTFGSECDANAFLSDSDGLFSKFSEIYFVEGNIYSDDICPFLFRKTILNLITLNYMNRSNFLGFSSIKNAPSKFDIAADINELEISYSKDVIIKKSMLDKYVFKNLSSLYFNVRLKKLKSLLSCNYNNFNLYFNSLGGIEDDAFIHTQNLKYIEFNGENFGQFIRRSNNKWMSSLNVDVVVNYRNKKSLEANRNRTLVISLDSVFSLYYNYPDEDLDRFKYFPHNRMVFFKIDNHGIYECTETKKFLLKNTHYFVSSEHDLYSPNSLQCAYILVPFYVPILMFITVPLLLILSMFLSNTEMRKVCLCKTKRLDKRKLILIYAQCVLDFLPLNIITVTYMILIPLVPTWFFLFEGFEIPLVPAWLFISEGFEFIIAIMLFGFMLSGVINNFICLLVFMKRKLRSHRFNWYFLFQSFTDTIWCLFHTILLIIQFKLENMHWVFAFFAKESFEKITQFIEYVFLE